MILVTKGRLKIYPVEKPWLGKDFYSFIANLPTSSSKNYITYENKTGEPVFKTAAVIFAGSLPFEHSSCLTYIYTLELNCEKTVKYEKFRCNCGE